MESTSSYRQELCAPSTLCVWETSFLPLSCCAMGKSVGTWQIYFPTQYNYLFLLWYISPFHRFSSEKERGLLTSSNLSGISSVSSHQGLIKGVMQGMFLNTPLCPNSPCFSCDCPNVSILRVSSCCCCCFDLKTGYSGFTSIFLTLLSPTYVLLMAFPLPRQKP